MKQTPESIYQKRSHELDYWNSAYCADKNNLTNSHYEYFYTTLFGFSPTSYKNKKILDIGCGPRGSLEWAVNAAECVGVDPLADSYQQFGINQHKMIYVNAGSESIPYPDQYFDTVCSFNSLDHVDDLNQTISEIKRVLCNGGHFLLITDVNHEPTHTEPIAFDWDVVDNFKPEFRIYNLQHYEKGEHGIYRSVRSEKEPYNHENATKRYGVLCAAFKKVATL